MAILYQEKEFCVLVQLLPMFIYHIEDNVLDFLDGTLGSIPTKVNPGGSCGTSDNWHGIQDSFLDVTKQTL